MTPVSIKDIEYHMPEKIVYNDYFGSGMKESTNKMFVGTKERRHIGNGELASDHMQICAEKIISRHGLDPKADIDMIVTNVSLPDEPFTGLGAVLNKRINGNVKYIFDMHNTGCVAFIYMLELVKTYMTVHDVRSALVCNSQTAAGRVFGQDDTRKMEQSCIPGDGTSVAYITSDTVNEVTHFTFKNFPEYSEDMFINCGGRKYWQSRTETGSIDFSEAKAAQILLRGNRMVPNAIYDVCEMANIKTTELSYLITNQPNQFFLRNWREATLLPEEKHLHTFEKYANLFGAGIPVTLAENMRKNLFAKGDIICLAGFSHAGDYAAAALVKWG